MSSWKNKVALITGSSQGFGKHLAGQFAAAGAHVVITGRNQGQADATAEAIRSGGLAASSFAADVTLPGQVADLFSWIRETHGSLDVLVNNVGRSTRGRASETEPEEFRELFEINFVSAVNCCARAIPLLVDSGGSIANIGSLACKSAGEHLGAYPASKFALAAYNHQLRAELKPRGVHVLLVCSGPIRREDAGPRYQDQARNLPPEASEPGGGVRLVGISPDRLAERVIRACEKRQPELVVPGRARLLFAISQVWPGLGDLILRRFN